MQVDPQPYGHPASSGPTNRGVHRSLTSHPWKNLSICPLTPEFSSLNHSGKNQECHLCVDSCSLVLHHEQLRKIQRSRSCRNTHLLRKCNGSHDDWYALSYDFHSIHFINSGWFNLILIAVGCCCYYFLVIILKRT